MLPNIRYLTCHTLGRHVSDPFRTLVLQDLYVQCLVKTTLFSNIGHNINEILTTRYDTRQLLNIPNMSPISATRHGISPSVMAPTFDI